MIKSQQAESKPSVCWWKEPQIPALRVELNDDTFVVLPYIHLGFAKLETRQERNLLFLSFSSHEIRITGRNLKELGIAIQRLSVEWIREASPRYTSLVKKDAVVIEKIEITEKATEGAISLHSQP